MERGEIEIMNQVNLIGRIVRDVEVKKTNDKSYCAFNLAINRGKDRNGNDMGADYPSVVAYGKTAENMGKFCKKGMLVGVSGNIKTGSYEKDGQKVYTTTIQASNVEFLERAEKKEDTATGFSQITDEQIPF